MVRLGGGEVRQGGGEVRQGGGGVRLGGKLACAWLMCSNACVHQIM